MSEQMPHDDELQALYRKLAAEEPRAEIDDAILAAARRAGGARWGRRALLRGLGWGLPLAAAAGVMLTVSLTRLGERPAILASPPAMLREPARMPRREREDARFKSLRDVEENFYGSDADDAAPAEKDDASPTAGVERKAEKAAESGSPASGVAAGRAQPEAPPAVPPAAASSEASSGREPGSPQTANAAGKLKAPADAMAAAPQAPAKEDPWPFGLEAGLAPEEACRRLRGALHGECVFHGDVAVVSPDRPTRVDRGSLAGNSIVRLTLSLRDGKLDRVTLRFAGDANSEAVLVAPGPR